MNKFMIFIPSFKSAHVITSVLDRIPAEVKKEASEIAVFDNASPDDIKTVVEAYKKKYPSLPLTYRRNARNLHYGGNVQAGCRYAVDRGMDVVVVLHSDGQYPAEDVGRLMQPLIDGKADSVFGSRIKNKGALKGGMPLWRFLGNIFLTQIENIITGTRFSEWHSGFRAYSCHALKQIPFEECDKQYQWSTDIYLLYLANGLKIVEIPIATHYGEESTSPSLKRTFLYFFHCNRLAFLYFLTNIGVLRIPKYRKAKK